MTFVRFFLISIMFITLTQCEQKKVNYQEEIPNKLTLGKVQQTLKKGMSQGEIVVELGSPNMVTADAEGLETWVYDKISTEVNSNSNKKGFNCFIIINSILATYLNIIILRQLILTI